MKRIIAIVLTALVLTALLCACGQKNAVVTTSVAEKYDDGYAKAFADSSSQSEDGKTVYQFNQEKYDDYRHDTTMSSPPICRRKSQRLTVRITASTYTSTKISRLSS